MEVGGGSRSLGFFWEKCAKIALNHLLIFWSSILCVFRLTYIAKRCWLL